MNCLNCPVIQDALGRRLKQISSGWTEKALKLEREADEASAC
jgi:hypothetical protein